MEENNISITKLETKISGDSLKLSYLLLYNIM